MSRSLRLISIKGRMSYPGGQPSRPFVLKGWFHVFKKLTFFVDCFENHSFSVLSRRSARFMVSRKVHSSVSPSVEVVRMREVRDRDKVTEVVLFDRYRPLKVTVSPLP